jgi:galactokinase
MFVPGRLCLFGEHSDWAGAYRAVDRTLAPGACLVAGTDQGLEATARPSDALIISSVLPDGRRVGPERIALVDLDATARAGGFFSYAAGAAAAVRFRFDVGGGVALDVHRNDLPLGKGLSSSAAISVLVVRAFSLVHGLGLDRRDEMALAWSGERRTGSQCGLMDQVCAFGRMTTSLAFDGTTFDVEPIGVGGPLHLLIVDLRRGKDTRRILADLNACFPSTPGAVAAAVRQALGPDNLRLVQAARAAIAAGDARGLGSLMDEAQAVFDARVAPACADLAAPRLHEVLAHPAVRTLGWGGKGVGSQGDGCAQIVARGPEEGARLAAILTRDFDVECFPLGMGPQA